MNKIIGITDVSFHIVMNTLCYGVEINKWWNHDIPYCLHHLIPNTVVHFILSRQQVASSYQVFPYYLHFMCHPTFHIQKHNVMQSGTNIKYWIEIISVWSYDDLDSRMFSLYNSFDCAHFLRPLLLNYELSLIILFIQIVNL